MADDDAFLALTRADGTVAHLWLSRSTSAPGPRFRAVGLDATLTVAAPETRTTRAGWPPRAWRAGSAASRWTPRCARPAEHERFYAGVRDALLEGGPMPVDPRDAVRTARILDAARASADTGTVVALGGDARPRTPSSRPG